MARFNIGMEYVRSITFFQFIFAEFVGTVILLYFGVLTYSNYGKQNLLQTALCFGFATACLVKTFGHICSGMFNPAITLSQMSGNIVTVIAGICAIIVQFVGAILGAALAYANKTREDDKMGVLEVSENISNIQAIILEMIATMVIAMVYFAVTDTRRIGYRNSAFIAIGLAVVAAHISIAAYTGAALNPARAFATSAVNNDSAIQDIRWKFMWIYMIGPCLGGLLAAVIYLLLFAVRSDSGCYPIDWF